MINFHLRKKLSFHKVISLILIILNLNSVTTFAFTFSNKDILLMKKELLESSDDKNSSDELKAQFQPLIENIFLNRNSAILTRDCEGLKLFYDLDKKVGKLGLWKRSN